MARHEIVLRLLEVTQDDEHRIRNFKEDIWLQLERHGWVEFENFDQWIRTGAEFTFTFPSRSSHQAVSIVRRSVRDHMAESLVQIEHTKR